MDREGLRKILSLVARGDRSVEAALGEQTVSPGGIMSLLSPAADDYLERLELIARGEQARFLRSGRRNGAAGPNLLQRAGGPEAEGRRLRRGVEMKEQ